MPSDGVKIFEGKLCKTCGAPLRIVVETLTSDGTPANSFTYECEGPERHLWTTLTVKVGTNQGIALYPKAVRLNSRLSATARDLLLKIQAGAKLFLAWSSERKPSYELDGEPLDALGPDELMRAGLIENKPLTDPIYGHRVPILLTPLGEEIAARV